jgi:hypothetical protein
MGGKESMERKVGMRENLKKKNNKERGEKGEI